MFWGYGEKEVERCEEIPTRASSLDLDDLNVSASIVACSPDDQNAYELLALLSIVRGWGRHLSSTFRVKWQRCIFLAGQREHSSRPNRDRGNDIY